MKSLRFVPLAEEHLDRVLAIEAASETAPWSRKAFENELDHEFGIFLVALAGGEIIGFGGVWIVVDEAHIVTIAVDPEHRRQGVGRRILAELLRCAKERGAVCSTLEVRAGNDAALGLYEGVGYARAGKRKGYYPDNKEDAVVMWLHDLDTWEPRI